MLLSGVTMCSRIRNPSGPLGTSWGEYFPRQIYQCAERPIDNQNSMMNNCWYTVKPEIRQDSDNSVPEITFYHPVEPATGTGGWLKESAELQISNARQIRTESKKQFTREEIEKHSNEHDCWIVVDEKVYDATSVLEWHPGGKAAVMGHAGKVHQDTTDNFGSIHDSYAYEKLNGKYASFASWSSYC